MNFRASVRHLALLTLVGGVGVAGCSIFNPSTLTPTGQIVRTHAKPIDQGYFDDWDPLAVSMQLDRVEDTTPVNNHEVYVATVLDRNGKPLAGRRVEWVIAEGSVGDIVQVDENGLSDGRGYKVNNKYGVSHTNFFDHVLDRGTDDPSDDIYLEAGQTFCVITSPVEGQTHLSAFAPAIYNWENHTVLARHNWFDVDWDMPTASTDPAGTSRTFTTRVYRHSDGTPLQDYAVRYEIATGPDGRFDMGDGQMAEVRTDSEGYARCTIQQSSPMEGTNDVMVTIIRPENSPCCSPSVKIAEGFTQEHWVGPKIALTKMAPAFANAGETFIIPITVSNASQVDCQNVVVTDPLPAGLEYVSSSPSGSYHNGSLSWSVGTLPAGAQQEYNVTVRGTQSGTFGSYAEVSADQNLVDNDYAETRIVNPSLTLSFEAPSEVLACDSITNTITVRNNGDGMANDVQIMGKVANGLNVEMGQNSKLFNIGSLAPGEAKQVSFRADPQDTGSFVSSAVATADGGLSAEASATTVVRQPRLSITKFGPDERFLGRSAEYEITVTNTGDTTANNVTITDTVPTGMSFVSASNGGSFGSGQVAWNIASLAPGQATTVSHKLRATGRGVARSTAWARAICADASTSAETTIIGIAALSLEVVDTADPIEVGDAATYEIRVTNQGSADATSIQLTCELPNGQEFMNGNGPSNATESGQKVTFAPVGTLSPKQQAVFRVTVKCTKPGDVRFKAWLTCDQQNEPVIETESTFMY